MIGSFFARFTSARRLALAALAGLSFQVASAQVTVTPTYLTNETLSPGSFYSLGNPTMNGAGSAIFRATIGVDTAHVQPAVYSGGRLVAKGQGQDNAVATATPGIAGGVFYDFQDPVGNSLGQTAFVASFVGGGAGGPGIWTESLGALALVVQRGDTAPGTGTTFGKIRLDALTDAGHLLFSSGLTPEDTETETSLWTGLPQSLALLARVGDAAPGLPAGTLFQSLSSRREINAEGSVAFAATTTTGNAIFVGTPGTLVVVGHPTQLAPETEEGTYFSDVPSHSLNAKGELALLAKLVSSQPDPFLSGSAIYAGKPDKLEIVARDGQTAPGGNGSDRWFDVDRPAINSSSEVAFTAAVGASTTQTKTAVFLGRKGQLRRIATVGDVVIGTNGATIYAIDSTLQLSDSGQLVFEGTLKIGEDDYARAVLGTDQVGALQLIARVGAPIGDSPTVAQIDLQGGAVSGGGESRSNGGNRRIAIDAQGRFAFHALWNDPTPNYPGREALFTAAFANSAPVFPAGGQPQNVRAAADGSAKLQAIVLGSRPATYRWQRNGQDVEGADSPVLKFENLTEAAAGTYVLKVHNSFGDQDSDPVTLSFPPVFTKQPPARLAGGAGTTITLQSNAAGPGTKTYQWEFRAVGGDTFGNVANASGATLTLSDLTPTQAGTYRVVVSNSYGSTTSRETLLTVAGAGQAIVQTLGRNGDRAVGYEGEVYFAGFTQAVINNAGEIAVQSGVLDGIGRTIPAGGGVLSGLPENLQLTFASSYGANLSDSGDATSNTNLFSFDNDNNNGYLHGKPGATSALAREGFQAPGTNGLFNLMGSAAINDVGTAAFRFTVGTVFTDALYFGTPGNLQLIALEGIQAPGLAPGVLLDEFIGGADHPPAFNHAEQALFYASLSGPGITADNDEGIWVATRSSVQRIVAEGAPVPGIANATFGYFTRGAREGSINNAGQIVFANVMNGSGVEPLDDDIIFAGLPNALQVVARGGQPAGSGFTYSDLNRDLPPLINRAGQVVFSSYDRRSTGGELAGLWRWTPGANGGSRKLIAREGEQAPGCPTGVVFAFQDPAVFQRMSVNASGAVAFFAGLSGPGVTAENQTGLFLTNAAGQAQLVVRTGQTFDFGNGDVRTLNEIVMTINADSGGEDGRARMLNDAGELLFTVRLDGLDDTALLKASLPPQAPTGPAPVVTTQAATGLGSAVATLKGTVNPKGEETTVHFEYGETNSLGTSTPAEAIGAGNSAVNVSANLTGLNPGTGYFFRLVATSANGPAQGSVLTFATADASGNLAPTKGTVVVSPPYGATVGTPITVSFNGWVDPEKKKPLTYQVQIDGTPVAPASTAKTVTFPAPAAGNYNLQARISDPQGGVATVDFTLEVLATPTLAVQTRAQTKDEELDPATGAPSGSIWGTFGLPTALPSGEVAFLATVKAPDRTFTGLFSGALAAPSLLLSTGDHPTDGVGGEITTATFSAFKEPAFAGNGRFAVAATVKGVSKSADTGIWARTSGSLRRVAGEGLPADEYPGATYSAFSSYAMSGDAVFFTASVKGVAKSADFGLWVWTPAAGAKLIVREGSSVPLPGGGSGTVKTVQALIANKVTPGEPGVLAYSAALHLTFTTGVQAHGRAFDDGTLLLEAQTNVTDTAGRTPTRFTLPDLNTEALGYAVGTDFKDKTKGIVTDEGLVVQTGTDAPGTGALFSAFGPPVIGTGDGVALAFQGVLKTKPGGPAVAGAAKAGIWYQDSAGTLLTLLARVGSIAPETGEAKFAALSSLAILPGRGPIFLGSLAAKSGNPKVTSANDRGLWGLSSTGALQLLLRENQTIGDRTVKTFNVLTTVLGSPAQARAFDGEQGIVVRAFYTDGTQGILKLTAP